MDASGGEAGDGGSLSSWNSDIGIPIHFKKSKASSLLKHRIPCASRGVKVI